MIRAQRKESVASVLPTTLGQGNFLDVASTKKGRRPMIAPSSTSLVWSSRGKFDQTITCHREIISSRDKGGRQTLGHGAEKNGRDDPALQPGRVLALRTCPQQKNTRLFLPSAIVGLWSGRLDLNQRLPRPERGALPD